MRRCRTTEGLTGLEIIIIIAVLLIFMYIAASAITGAYGTTEKKEGGMVVNAVTPESEILVIDGETDGIQDTGGAVMSVNLICEDSDPSSMGSCLIPVRLLVGSTGSIDITTVKVLFNHNSVTETLPFTAAGTISKPAWTVADRSSVIPLLDADEDLSLEANEIFTLLIYPENPVPAEDFFTITISAEKMTPLVQEFRVPPSIRSQRIVELFRE
ncbi:hypothetical protein [Methanolacinia paynteri]|uniref:hypothetical protein n=1 Tax=Methanolacinia paynteri TaxID=230356 RepID=UPI00064F782B|nr:hypothetical protein [Methanolacinia paynteri]